MSGNFILGLDLDGVVMDYTHGFRQHVAKAKSLDPAELVEPTTWDFTGWPIDDRDEFEELHTGAVKSGLFLSSPLMTGASEALWKLSDEGVFIRIITNRFVGNGNHAISGADTFRWLDCNNVPFREICFVANKTDVYADAYLDDSPSNLNKYRTGCSAKQIPITFDAPYNQDVPNDIPRVYGWDDAYQLISEINRMWKYANTI